MPLPDTSTSADLAWPPASLAPAWPKMAEWSAWYSNDPNVLGGLYANRSLTSAAVRPSQFSGGVQGTLARWFWGTPAVPGQQRAKVHLPVASDICAASSDLLFAEALKVTVPDGTSATAQAAYTDRLQVLLDGIAWESLLPEQGELNAALGGVYLRAVWDRDVEPDQPLATAVHADAAWPEFAFGRLRAVTFWEKVAESGTTVLRLLERHEVGRIEFGVYEGTKDKLGRVVPFAELTRYGIAQPDVDPGGDGVSVATGIPYLTAVYVPNIKPSRGWRSHPVCNNLGRSDLDGIEPLLDAADETMTSWMRDVRLGKGRIIVPEWMLRNGGLSGASSGRVSGGGSIFNIDQEVFTGLTAPPAEVDGMKNQLTVQQFAIRTKEHADTLNGILTNAFRGAGYSQQTFGLADENAATATEVSSRDRRSDTTREKKSRYYSDALSRFLRAFVALDTAQFNGTAGLDVLPVVAFAPASRPDPLAQSQTVQALRAAQVLSIYTGVKMVQPDLDEKEVEAEVKRIADDTAASMPTLTDLGALPGDEGGGQVNPVTGDPVAAPGRPGVPAA